MHIPSPSLIPACGSTSQRPLWITKINQRRSTGHRFQCNAGGSFTLENVTADTFGKAIRTNGGHPIDTDIVLRNSHFTNGDEAIVRNDATLASITPEGVTFSDGPNDVLAPSGTEVNGAVKRSSK